jgi:hypothetical protein
MTISELVSELEALRIEHGDLEIATSGYTEEFWNTQDTYEMEECQATTNAKVFTSVEDVGNHPKLMLHANVDA